MTSSVSGLGDSGSRSRRTRSASSAACASRSQARDQLAPTGRSAVLRGRGTRLPILLADLYLLAAAAALGVDPAAGEAQYFYATRKGDYKRVPFTGAELEARRDDLERLLSELRDGMHGGDFHAEPSRECDWCDFNGVCDARRFKIRDRKADDPHAARVTARREEVT